MLNPWGGRSCPPRPHGAVMDTRLKVVTIMNYPPEPRLRRMCRIFLDSVIARGAASVTILYEDHEPEVAPEHRRAADVEVVRCRSRDVGHPHFNLRFKLPNLAALDYPFIYLDADTVVLDDLSFLWERRHAKPWVGIDHQWIPADARTHRDPFLNSGVQLVSDPAFYDLNAILAAQNAVAPLARAAEFTKEQMFACPGADQAVLFRYFRSIGYDYRHPEVGPEWNSCAGVTDVWRAGDRWRARTRGLAADHDVSLVHYWSAFKPWAVNCPIFASYGDLTPK
ncbi:---NA--- : : Glyco_transf_8 [Gemmataceae bacterium]|nr:---NA--- : : Glyco_transf_8 [Gemmataceae bacterium]VTT97641.1 ---NA--- : : Glyco_transf_8 [Gemmataceae bacterium]